MTSAHVSVMPIEPPAVVAPVMWCKSAPGSNSAELDRERLCNDLLNTSVVAALIGGFALATLQLGKPGGNFLDLSVYMLNVFAVHTCTCSCLTSVFLYQKANGLHDDHVTAWACDKRWLLSLPMVKFVAGCVCYLLSVLLLTFRDLEASTFCRFIALAIGAGSVMMVFMTAAYIHFSSRACNYFKTLEKQA
eukprot:TRINITY_DN75243_c0_g1_i1.p1 TRINITY_DN75243_c0_g1~~TRINITY_DN75243_c0_g1_i1.p1  ORF type:complete len:191 (+),score=18.14 TRINITY_DN75243_c0_g1_i1:65-637(+)